MVGVGAVDVPDSEVINDETENEVAGLVMPKARCQLAQFVTVRCEEGNELIVGDAAGLWKTVHAALYLDVYEPIVRERFQVVLLNDGGGQHPNGDSHVFVMLHWCPEIKILHVGS